MESDDWRDDAICNGTELSDWFPEERNPIHTKIYREELAELRAICALCPVSKECLEYALLSPFSVDHGIYAGTTPEQRKLLLKTIDTEEEVD